MRRRVFRYQTPVYDVDNNMKHCVSPWIIAFSLILLLLGSFLAEDRFPALATDRTPSVAANRITAFTKNAKILFQGDSITHGGRGGDPNHFMGHGYQYIIAAKYGAAFPELKLDFLNRGVSGDTVLNLDARWKQDTLALKPDVLSIYIGTNDFSKVPIEQYEKTYDKILADARRENPKLKLVLCEPFAKPTGEVPEKMRQMQKIVAKLAKKYNAAFVRLQHVFDEAVRRAPADYWVWDSVHPTYRGHQLIANEWERTVRDFWPNGK
jgi:lysophospholipase L1-like esterase